MLMGTREHFLESAEHERQGSSKFMRYVREERGFGAIEFRERFGSFALLLISLSVGDGRGNVSGNQLQETLIGVVIPAKRVQAGDEDAGAPRRPRRCDRNRDGFRRL